MKRRSFSGGWCGEKGLTQGIRPAILGMHVLTAKEQTRQMAGKGTKNTKEAREPKKQTPTFLLELPLVAGPAQAKRLRAHLEAGRQFYNALLSEGQRRLLQMRADPAWQAARAIPHTRTQERAAAFRALREQHGFSEDALQEYAKSARCTWMADHLDAVLAQTLASRAYQALNRVCVGNARRVRFKSRGRGLSSIENKRNDTGLRFVLHKPEEGKQGYLIWKDDQLAALIDWNDPVVKYGLDHRIKYARLIQRKASSPQAQGADGEGFRYFVQLALEGVPYHKPKHAVGSDTVGADLGPSTIALVPQQAEASLEVFCEELAPDEKHVRRLQRKMERQRRAANPDNYDEQGRIKKTGKKQLHWKSSKTYEKMRRRKATKERKLAACVDRAEPRRACAQYVIPWGGAEARLRLAHERVQQRANEGQSLPRSMGVPRARARRPESRSEPTQEPAFSLRRGRLEAWKERENPRGLSPGSTQFKKDGRPRVGHAAPTVGSVAQLESACAASHPRCPPPAPG